MKTKTFASQRMLTPAGALLAAMALGLGLGGCRKPAGPAHAATAASPPSTLPASAPTEPEDESAMEIIIKADPQATSRHAPTYTRDDQVASGSLRGAVRFAPPLARGQMPAAKLVDVAAAIRQPAAGELEYYKNIAPRQGTFVSGENQTPHSVVVRLLNITKGRRDPLKLATYLLRQGQYQPFIQFAPRHERIMFGTYDFFPTQTVVTGPADGRVYMDALVEAYDRSKIRDLGGGGVELKRPTMAQSQVVHDAGVYAITCKRHAWKTAYAVVVDNPYALVVDDRRGQFLLDAVPEGTWELKAWHPVFEVLQPRQRVTIKKDEAAEVLIELRNPWAAKQ